MEWIIQKRVFEDRWYHDFAAFEEEDAAVKYLDSNGGTPGLRLVRRDITDYVSVGLEDGEI